MLHDRRIQFTTYLCLGKNGSVASGGAHAIGHPGADELRLQELVVVQFADDAGRGELVREMVFDRVEEAQGGIRGQYPGEEKKKREGLITVSRSSG